MNGLPQRLERIRQRIHAAERAAGVPPGSVELVAVTKYHPPEVLRALYDLGVRQFGESRAQELAGKVGALPDDISWHMIGHLQENKINKILPHVAMIQSVDSWSIAEAISKRAERLQRVIPVLLEVKTAHEGSKTGVPPEDTPELHARMARLPGLEVRGLMTLAPHSTDEVLVRSSFRSLRRLYDTLQTGKPAPRILSMGMSQDFEWAIQEGSNMVRIGRALIDA